MPPAPPGDRQMRIAVDAMGGDGGVPVNVEGAIAAAREYALDVILVGEQATIERELSRHRVGKLPITVRHASQVVDMGEQPSHALRRKRDSSMRVAASLVRDGEASAFISSGNTGAAMAIAMFTMGVLPGVDRPAIAVVLPNKRGRTILLDVGANIDPKPWHLAQYAVMGHVYARDILGVAEPRVGLLPSARRRARATSWSGTFSSGSTNPRSTSSGTSRAATSTMATWTWSSRTASPATSA